MSGIGALVSDLDGTLLNTDHCVPERYDDLSRLLASRGIAFYVASARPLGSVRKLFEGRLSPAGIIACDGAIIASLSRGLITQYLENPLRNEDAQTSFAAIKEAGVQPVLFLTREHDFSVVVSTEETHVVSDLGKSDPTRPIALVSSDDLAAVVKEVSVRAISALGEREIVGRATLAVCSALSEVKGIRAYSYDETRFGEGRLAWLDVVSTITSKEEAIDRLLGMQGFAGQRFVACGNGENDRLMLAKASRAYCPSNAVASVRDVCGSTCSPVCEGDAFVDWLIDQLGGPECW
jgi:hydroxymethylpyrimidine pyrophosphatase-like HAD family hydrolase